MERREEGKGVVEEGGSERQRGEGGVGRERKGEGKGKHVDEQISKVANVRTVNEFAS